MMKGRSNMDGVDEGGFLLPLNEYHFCITEKIDKTTKNKDPMVAIKLTVVRGEFKGSWVWDNITLSDNPQSPGYKILGRSKHFLHCIGEPYEGDIEWDSDRWLGKECDAIVGHEEPNEYHRNKRAVITEYFIKEDKNTGQPEEEIPF